MPFQKGQSGNPNGRPPKNRSLTDILERAGNVTVDHEGKKVARKRILAQMLWEAVTTGKTKAPDGTQLEIDPQDWLGLVKFLYGHIDGPPPKQVDMTSGGEPMTGLIINLTDDDD